MSTLTVNTLYTSYTALVFNFSWVFLEKASFSFVLGFKGSSLW